MVNGVIRGASLAPQLAAVPAALRPGAQALVYFALRRLGTAQAVRMQLVARRPAPPVDALLVTSIALLVGEGERPYPDFTLVDQAVEAAKRSRTMRAQSAFVNACLRRLLRERSALLAAVSTDPVAHWNHPLWWIERLQRDHPDHWQSILHANQVPAPMDLRVHIGRASPAQYADLLARRGIAGQALAGSRVRLDRPRPVHELPGFEDGWVSVQSSSAQRAAPLLLDGLGTHAPRILDACAAPGGKMAHLLESCPTARVTALDIDPARVPRIQQNLARLKLRAEEVRVADAADVASWWRGEAYDAIMLDAPCSASGIVRRHPDVRWLRREADLAQLAARQDRLLMALWPLLKPGGRLLYCTCSVFRAEGAQPIQSFVARNTDAVSLAAPGQLLPSIADAPPGVGDNGDREDDGFFYALLEKRPP